MKRMRFTAQELYVMAAIAGKDKMFGIPDGFSGISEEELPAIRQQVFDSLLDEGVIRMNFEGRYSVSEQYSAMIMIYCDCTKCLTINRQSADGDTENMIYWQYNGDFFAAEVDGNYYFLRKSSPAEVGQLSVYGFGSYTMDIQNGETIVPQIALKKAKRSIEEKDIENATRILKQNGADERVAAIVLDGLQEKAHYLRLLFIDTIDAGGKEIEKSWLSSRRVIISLRQAVVNYRSCVCFSEVTKKTVEQDVHGILENFLTVK